MPSSKPTSPDENVPKLKYRRVQEMIKTHTVKNIENQLDRDVKDNMKKITKLYQMKNAKYDKNDSYLSNRMTNHGSSKQQSMTNCSEARNSEIHQVLPASLSSKKQ